MVGFPYLYLSWESKNPTKANTMRVTLRKRKNSDGTTSLFLAIWDKNKPRKKDGQLGDYRYEFLHHLKLSKVSNPGDRQKNKESLDLAEKIAAKRAHEYAANDYAFDMETGKKADAMVWMQHYVDKYKLKDKRNLQGALNRFKAYLMDQGIEGIITFNRMDDLLIEGYRDALKKSSKGEGAAISFSSLVLVPLDKSQASNFSRSKNSRLPLGLLCGTIFCAVSL